MSANNIIVRNKACSYPAPGLVGALVENQRLPSGISVEKIRFYPSIKEALFAVNNGEADFIYGLSSRMEQDILRYHFTNLAPVTLVNDQSTISFALPIPVDPDLLTILNKAINNLSESERTVIRNRNLESIGVSEFSLTDFIYANPFTIHVYRDVCPGIGAIYGITAGYRGPDESDRDIRAPETG